MPRVTAQKFREFHRRHGESFRWFKALPETTGNGRSYVEQNVEARTQIMVHNTRREMQDTEFGLIAPGTTMAAVMPDEAFLGRNDRIVLVQRSMLARVLLVRSGASERLPQRYGIQVQEIRAGGSLLVAGTHYTVSGSTITWKVAAGTPAIGDSFSVEYLYQPVFEYLPLGTQMPRPDRKGVLMPLRGMLVQVVQFEDDE